MSVIINNMAMPQNCYECRFREINYSGTSFCVAHFKYIEDTTSGRLDTCPLVEVPDNIPAEGEIDKWWERSETVNAERSEE